MFFKKPGFILRCIGAKDGEMDFFMNTLKDGLLPTAEAPLQFQAWVERILFDWDFDNICAAHQGNKIGGAKLQLNQTLERYKVKLAKLSIDNKAKANATANKQKVAVK
jgi:hypothetical protein